MALDQVAIKTEWTLLAAPHPCSVLLHECLLFHGWIPSSESSDQTGHVGEDFFQHVAVHHFSLGHLSDAVALG